MPKFKNSNVTFWAIFKQWKLTFDWGVFNQFSFLLFLWRKCPIIFLSSASSKTEKDGQQTRKTDIDWWPPCHHWQFYVFCNNFCTGIQRSRINYCKAKLEFLRSPTILFWIRFHSKCIIQNVSLKVSFLKCLIENVVENASSKCLIENVWCKLSQKMSHSKCLLKMCDANCLKQHVS